MANNTYIIKAKTAEFPYAFNWLSQDKTCISITGADAHDLPDLRIDFNPWLKTEDEKKEIYKILRYFVRPRVTRLDVAIDYYMIDLSLCEWVEQRTRKRQEWYGTGGRLETLYLGSFKSDGLVRIYNKALKEDREGLWWRVESQRRYKPGDKYFSKNPFQGLYCTPRDSPSPGQILPMSEMAMLEFLERHPSAISEMDRRTRYKYRRLIKERAQANMISPTPAEAYEKNKDQLRRELAHWTGKCSKASKQA